MNSLKIAMVCLIADNFDGGKVENAKRSMEALAQYSKELGYDFYAYPKLVFSLQDANEAAAAITKEAPDFLMIQLTAFPNGEAVIRLAKSCKKLGIWAIPESSYEGSNFINSNNSFCGMNMSCSIVANYLKDMGIQYKWFFGFADQERFFKRFSLTVKALTAIKKLMHSRVALVGGIARGFNDLYFDERLALSRLGVEIQRGHEFSEIKSRAHSYNDTEMEPLAACYACARCTSDVTKEDLLIGARYYRAYREFAEENGYDALAVSCWPQIKEDTLACSIIGKLNQNGIPASCEGDMAGAISMLLMKYITDVPATLMDLSALDETDETALVWHCGPSAETYAGEGGAATSCSYQLTMDGQVLRLGTIHDMLLKPQPITIMRIAGEWDQMFLLDGKVSDRKKPSPDGCRGWVESIRLNRKPIKIADLTNTILVSGFQHHYPIMAGDITEVLMEVASWLNLKLFREIPYADYRQTPEL